MSGERKRRGLLLVLAVTLLLLSLAALRVLNGRTQSSELAEPSAATTPGQLFFDEGFGVRLWMPTPADSLPLLMPPDALAAPGGLRFGPFALPPAREAAVALAADGGVAAFRFAPWQATLARWAGRLAGNPVLAGGRVERASREVRVRWLDATWIVTVDATWQPRPVRARPAGLGEALGWVTLGESVRRELARVLRVEVDGAPFEIVALDDGWGLRQRGATWATPWAGPQSSALAAARYERRADGWALTLLEAPRGEPRPGELRLPSSGARYSGSFSPLQLPAGRWLEDLALNPLYADCGPSTCVAWDQAGLRLARAAEPPTAGAVGTWAWTWNAALADFLDRFATGLDGLLLVPSRDVESARSAATWAQRLRPWPLASLHAEPGALAVRFWTADLD